MDRPASGRAGGAALQHADALLAVRQAGGVFDTQPTQPTQPMQPTQPTQPPHQPPTQLQMQLVQRAPVLASVVTATPIIANTTPADVDRARHPSGIVPLVQNVVATVNLGCPLELKKIAMQARNAEYNPKRFTAVIMRLLDPKTTALIFASGKVVVTGAKSEDAARLAARKFARIIQKLDFPARFTDFKVQNIVASCDVRFAIRLEGLAANHGQFSSVRARDPGCPCQPPRAALPPPPPSRAARRARGPASARFALSPPPRSLCLPSHPHPYCPPMQYEPELFPGLIYRHQAPKVVLLIFVSGKVVLTGAKVYARSGWASGACLAYRGLGCALPPSAPRSLPTPLARPPVLTTYPRPRVSSAAGPQRHVHRVREHVQRSQGLPESAVIVSAPVPSSPREQSMRK